MARAKHQAAGAPVAGRASGPEMARLIREVLDTLAKAERDRVLRGASEPNRRDWQSTPEKVRVDFSPGRSGHDAVRRISRARPVVLPIRRAHPRQAPPGTVPRHGNSSERSCPKALRCLTPRLAAPNAPATIPTKWLGAVGRRRSRRAARFLEQRWRPITLPLEANDMAPDPAQTPGSQ